MQREAAFLRAWTDAPSLSLADHDDGDDVPPPGTARQRFRTLWISDLHLGTPGCQANALLDFLRRTESDTLFLVGDIIDGWQLRRTWYWPQSHNDVIQTVSYTHLTLPTKRIV